MLSRCAVLFAATLLLWLSPLQLAYSADLPELHYIAGRFPPYTQVDANDIPVGPTAALIAALAGKIGRPAPLQVVPFARAITAAEHEPNTLIALLAPDAAREAKFQWVCPVLDFDVAVFRLRERGDVVADGLEQLKRWRIVGVNRDVKTEYLLRKGIPVQIAADEDEAVRLLLHDRVDAMPAHPATMQMRLREAGQRSDTVVQILKLRDITSRLYLAFGPRTAPDVVEAVRDACYRMIASGEARQLMQPVMQN
jgi:polar amino acid transport system substrate-binding protein